MIYLPFPVIEIKSNYQIYEDGNLIRFSPSNISYYGYSNDNNWIFAGRTKVPTNHIDKVIGNVVVQKSDDIEPADALELLTLSYTDHGVLNDYFDEALNEIIDSIIDDPSWDDIKANIEEFKTNASIENKLVLLKIFSDHYVGAEDYDGYTPPFILDYSCDYYQVKDGNIEWFK